jgi:spermidine synthase
LTIVVLLYICIRLERKNLGFFILSLIVIGFGGIVAQTILVREMLIVFAGNEFSLGVILGSWVIWEAIGAFFAGKLAGRVEKHARLLSWLIILFSLSFPLSISLVRMFKGLAGIPPEVGVGIWEVFYSSGLILFPTGFLHGLLFTAACSVYDRLTGAGTGSVSRVYFFEMFGTIIGGLLVSYLLIPRFTSFHIAIGVAGLGALICVPLLLGSGGRRPIITLSVATLVVVSSVWLLNWSGADEIQRETIKRQWGNRDLIHYENSLYQNIVVVRNGEQYTFFTDGVPTVTTPVPDIARVEDFAHFPLLSNLEPKDILVLGGGAGGLINEILKHPSVRSIDYVEIDPAFLKTIERFPTPLTRRELDNPVVTRHYVDGRIFLRETQRTYDVVLLGVPSPSTLQANRFFSAEFFRLVKKHLRDKGIFALTVAGSLAYYNAELKDLNSCILQTLGTAFPTRFIIPGDVNIFMVSNSPDVAAINPSALYERLTARNIETRLITNAYLNYRLDGQWRQWFSSALRGADSSMNSDFLPKAVFYSVALNSLLFTPSLKPVFELARKIRFNFGVIFVGVLFLMLLLLQRKYHAISISFAIGTTGFTSMVLELALVFGFQVFYGYVFREIGILITSFMGGLAAGSILAALIPGRTRGGIQVFRVTEAAMIVCPLAVVVLFRRFDVLSLYGPDTIRSIFLALLFAAGFLTGIEFPLASRIYEGYNRGFDPFRTAPVGETVGALYGLDLLGGWIGGILGGFIIIPILGLVNGCYLLAVLKTSSFLLLFTLPKK